MQKIWKQIGFNNVDFNLLEQLKEAEDLKNDTEAIHLIVSRYKNYQKIIDRLEEQLHKSKQKKLDEGDSEHE